MTGHTSLTRATPDAIAASLEDELVAGQMPAGTRLPSERQLALRMGVSRPVVREALRTLVERGLLEVAPGRGAYVREPGSDVSRAMTTAYRRRNATTRHLVEARIMLECQAASAAAERATDEDVASLTAALARLEGASGVVERSRADVAFHRAISQAAHNPVIETMFASIGGLVFEHMLRSHTEVRIASEAHPYHVACLEAIRRRDPDGAAQAMRRHLEVATLLYGDDYDRDVEQLARRELERLVASGGADARTTRILSEALPPRAAPGDAEPTAPGPVEAGTA